MENTQTNGHNKQRVHWTQTPEGRRRVSNITKKRWKNTAKGKNELAIELLLDQLDETRMRTLLKRILLNR